MRQYNCVGNNKERRNQMANTIEYVDSPNVDTAFVVQEGGQKNRAVLTAPQDTTTLELPDNPNSTKGYVTINGKKHKVILVADISGNGGGGGSVDYSKVVSKTKTMPVASADNANIIYLYDGSTNATYTHGYIYENVKTATYTGTVSFEAATLSGTTVACSGDNFANFLTEAGADPTPIVSGTMTYEADATGWRLVGKDANNNTVSSFLEYNEDYQDAGFTFTGRPQDEDVIAFTCAIEEASATYTWTRINVQPTSGGGGAVDSVNGKTGNVVLDAEDVGAIPQYTTMPTASVSNLGEVAQYVGTDTNDYKNGYFYKNEATYTDPSATISQTAGSGLTDLSVDVDLFVAEEQPSGDESVSFVANVTPDVTEVVEATISPEDYIFDSATYVAKVKSTWSDPTAQDEYGFGIKYLVYDGQEHQDGWGLCYNADGSGQVASFIDPAEWGLTVINQPSSWNYIKISTTKGSTTWTKSGNTVDLSAYGISYSGTPVDDDTLTVVYIAPVVSGYAWEQINVQPAGSGGDGGIEWKTKVDLPADVQPTSWGVAPTFRIVGGLPNGEYEMYYQCKNANTNGSNYPHALMTVKIVFNIDNTNDTAVGSLTPVIDGNLITSANRMLPKEPTSLWSFFCKDGSDIVFYVNDDVFWKTDIHGYQPETAVSECFKLSAIKNVNTGEEYIATGSIWNNESYTSMSTSVVSYTPLITQPTIPSYYVRSSADADIGTGIVFYGINFSNNQINGVTELSVSLNLNNDEFNAKLKNLAEGYELVIDTATGVFANTQFVTQSGWAIVVKLNFPSGTTGTINYSVGFMGGNSESKSCSFTAEDLSSAVALNALKVGETPVVPNYLGKICQYTGTTDANYTNGYFYKATGTIVTVPSSVTCTETSGTGSTITMDVDNFVSAISSILGWSSETTLSYLNNGNMFSYFPEVPELYWGVYGTFSQVDTATLMQYITISPAVLTGQIDWVTSNVVPESRTIQNGAWTQVDVQPAPAGLPNTLDSNNYSLTLGFTESGYIFKTTYAGLGNNVPSGASFVTVFGSANTSVASGCSVVGTGNAIYSSDVSIVGSNNTVDGGIAETCVIGNGNGNRVITEKGFYWATYSVDYKILDANGNLPADRLASTTGLADGNYRLRLTMSNGVPTLTWVAE